MKDFQGKSAFITGGASGIGAGMAHAFADAGIRLVLADFNENKLAETVALFRARGANVSGVTLNVASMDSWKAARDATLESHGAIDILCNNAGVAPAKRRLEDISEEDWHWIFSVNVHGVHNGVRTWLPDMKAAGRPAHIVNTASMLGLFANTRSAEYVATKFAVVGMSETLKMELADTNIGVSVLCPGLVRTSLMSDRAVHQKLSGRESDDEGRGRLLKGFEALDPKTVGDAVLSAIQTASFTSSPSRNMRTPSITDTSGFKANIASSNRPVKTRRHSAATR